MCFHRIEGETPGMTPVAGHKSVSIEMSSVDLSDVLLVRRAWSGLLIE